MRARSVDACTSSDAFQFWALVQVGEGTLDLVAKPLDGVRDGGIDDGIDGAIGGGISLVRNTINGVVQSVGGITDTLATAAAHASMDSRYVRRDGFVVYTPRMRRLCWSLTTSLWMCADTLHAASMEEAVELALVVAGRQREAVLDSMLSTTRGSGMGSRSFARHVTHLSLIHI